MKQHKNKQEQEWPVEVLRNGVIRRLSKKRAEKFQEQTKTNIRNTPDLLAALKGLRLSADQLATCAPADEKKWIDQVLEDCEIADAAIRDAEGLQ